MVCAKVRWLVKLMDAKVRWSTRYSKVRWSNTPKSDGVGNVCDVTLLWRQSRRNLTSACPDEYFSKINWRKGRSEHLWENSDSHVLSDVLFISFIELWRMIKDHRILACQTIALWGMMGNHRTLACQTIGVWRRPSHFGTTIALWSAIALWSPTYICNLINYLITSALLV